MGTGTSTAGRNGRASGTKSKPAIRPNGRHGDGVSYAAINPDTVRSIVQAVATSGGAVMFGQTRDGGAYSVMILMDDEKIKEYPRDQTDFDNLLVWLVEEYLL